MAASDSGSPKYHAITQLDLDHNEIDQRGGDRLESELPVDSEPDSDEYDDLKEPQSFSNPPINKYRMIAACMILLAVGVNDQAPGALIPYIEAYYNISYGVVSLMFISAAMGAFCTAFLIDPLKRTIGTANTFMLTQGMLACSHAVISISPPWFLVVGACFVIGICQATPIALANVFVSNLQDGTRLMGIMHAFFCIGGITGPLVATSLAVRHILWSRFYIMPLMMAVSNMFFSKWSFQDYSDDHKTGENVESLEDQSPISRAREAKKELSTVRSCLKPFNSKVVILAALYFVSYSSIEITNSGWAIAYMIDYRHGDPTIVGYVTVGFWIGATIGRLLVPRFAGTFGESRLIYTFSVGIIGCQFIFWMIDSVALETVALIILGFLLGPMYPIAMAFFVRKLDPEQQLAGTSAIAAMGAFGSFIGPFVVGIVAQYTGLWVLNPVNIMFCSTMIVCWFSVSRIERSQG